LPSSGRAWRSARCRRARPRMAVSPLASPSRRLPTPMFISRTQLRDGSSGLPRPSNTSHPINHSFAVSNNGELTTDVPAPPRPFLRRSSGAVLRLHGRDVRARLLLYVPTPSPQPKAPSTACDLGHLARLFLNLRLTPQGTVKRHSRGEKRSRTRVPRAVRQRQARPRFARTTHRRERPSTQ
jgi:hypothetical protein